MKSDHKVIAKDIGVDLHTKSESQTYRWLLACLLFGKPIQQAVVLRTYEALLRAGATSLRALSNYSWEAIVVVLDKAHYTRYDFSTATKLLTIANYIITTYGSVCGMLKACKNKDEFEKQFLALPGVGPVTTEIFMREVAPLWYPNASDDEYEAAVWAAKLLNRKGFQAYIIGGAVRDMLIGRQPKDFDLATDALPDQVMAIKGFKQSFFKDTAQAYGVTRVVFTHNDKKIDIEIATFRTDIDAHLGRKETKVRHATLEDDVHRRDFTVNALVLDPLTNQVVDYVDGIDDVHNRLIRFIGNPKNRIAEDPLRIMRAVRFKNHLNFSYQQQTHRAIVRAVKNGYIEKIAADRIRNELSALLVHTTRRQALVDMNNFGILKIILPELVACKGVPQPLQYHAEGDVWSHELLTMDYLPSTPSKRLVWAALLHDIGKPATYTEPHQKSDRIRFNRHYAVGAEMAKTILRRLNFSVKDTNDICWIVYNHMAIDDLPSMRPSNQQKMLGHPAFADLLELHRADAAASLKPSTRRVRKPRFIAIEKIWHDYLQKTPEHQQPSLKRDLGIDGNWVINTFMPRYGRLSGQQIGLLLKDFDDWYRNERVTKTQAYKRRGEILLRKHEKSSKNLAIKDI